MAKAINIDKDKSELIKILQKTIQSCNLNFLIGSGCSIPAMKALGPIEQEVEALYKKNKETEAEKKLAGFLKPFIESTKQLIDNKPDDNHKTTIKNYSEFLKAISLLLFERKSHILHKQATIFSTNYDMFIEKAVEDFSDTIILNDGFCRNPSLTNAYSFSPRSFFNTVSNTGNLYKYQVEIPSINLIKIHGSLNWQICEGKIYQSLEHLKNTESKADKDFIDAFTLILPRKDKFNETLLNQIYYDLLRIYSNELDKENTLLIAEGFSFADEHIYDITKRALKNPTMRLIIFCFQESELEEYNNKFDTCNNVNIVYSDSANIDFGKFITILSEILPQKEEHPVYKVEIKEPKDE
jgi:hypothetical protein